MSTSTTFGRMVTAACANRRSRERARAAASATGRKDGSSGPAPPFGQLRSTKPTSTLPAAEGRLAQQPAVDGIEVRTPATAKSRQRAVEPGQRLVARLAPRHELREQRVVLDAHLATRRDAHVHAQARAGRRRNTEMRPGEGRKPREGSSA